MPADNPPSTLQSAPKPIAEGLGDLWTLDPAVTFLNHGSFGATPRAILEAQSAWRARFEARPIEMLDRRRGELLAETKHTVGTFVGAQAADFGFVTNATGGINAVLRSLRFEVGDEILTTNHVYHAIRQTIRYVAERAGARSIEVDIDLPIASPNDIMAPIEAALHDRTRLVVIDHITSTTAVLLPIDRIIDLCQQRGVDVLVDGAHAPGMIELDIESLGPAYYAANLHKWVCAPKGAALLWVRPDRQGSIHPNTISHFLNEGLAAEFAWQGTRDITAWLCAADAIEFMAGIGWPRIRTYNHELAVWVQAMLSERWAVQPSTPRDGSMLGSMATIALPDEAKAAGTVEAFQARLYDEHRIEVPVLEWNQRWWVRPCCQIYNTAQDYERLAEAVVSLCASTGR
ncbi:MAG: aminotransferase class V-fold PLP-dependent enzyme [Phycisphaerales bacterium]